METNRRTEYSSVQTACDLLNEMNRVKEIMFGEICWKFTMPQLQYFSNPRKNYLGYKHKAVPKKYGGVREISSPCRMLKAFQSVAADMLGGCYQAPAQVMGFVPGRAVTDNAARHIKKNYVFNADLKDFFPSITRRRVESVLKRPPFSFGAEAAHLLSGICCAYADLTLRAEDISGQIRAAHCNGVLKRNEDFLPKTVATLPQGAPTSPVLSNAVCSRLDKRLEGLAVRYELKYTRYADDITFSGNHNVFRDGNSFMKDFRKIVTDEGFTVNESKLRVQEKGQRQEVTGIVVNRKMNVRREYIRSIGSLLHIWEKFGEDAAYACFLRHDTEWKAAKGTKHDSVFFRPNMEETIMGRLAWLRMVRGAQDPICGRLDARFRALIKESRSSGIVGSPTRYLHIWTIRRFEQLSGMKLRYGTNRWGLFDEWTYNIFYLERNNFKTYVHTSKYCRTRLEGAINEGGEEALELLKSEYCIGLCAWMDQPIISVERVDKEKECRRYWAIKRKLLNHTYSGMSVFWKIIRKPPDNEDLPY